MTMLRGDEYEKGSNYDTWNFYGINEHNIFLQIWQWNDIFK